MRKKNRTKVGEKSIEKPLQTAIEEEEAKKAGRVDHAVLCDSVFFSFPNEHVLIPKIV